MHRWNLHRVPPQDWSTFFWYWKPWGRSRRLPPGAAEDLLWYVQFSLKDILIKVINERKIQVAWHILEPATRTGLYCALTTSLHCHDLIDMLVIRDATWAFFERMCCSTQNYFWLRHWSEISNGTNFWHCRLTMNIRLAHPVEGSKPRFFPHLRVPT